MLCTPWCVEYICALVTVYWNCPFTYSYFTDSELLREKDHVLSNCILRPPKQCLARSRFSKNTVHKVNKDTEGMT